MLRHRLKTRNGDKTEGRVLGTGAKMFIIAGPVIVYGTLAAVLYGSVYWLLR